MNPVAEEMLELMHYGIKRRSGRYPWGSGDDPYQHGRDFLGRIEELKKTGWTETPENIKKEFGLTTTQYRTEKSLAKDERRMLDVARAKSLTKDGLGATEIGRIMGISESTVRSLLNAKSESRMNQSRQVADLIKEQIDKKGMIDVGTGVEREIGKMIGASVSKEKLNQALYLLEREGYPVYNNRFEQVTNRGNFTTQKVIGPPGTQYKDIYKLDEVHSFSDYAPNETVANTDKFVYPKSMDSKRLMVRYAEEGGIEKDGIVEVRRGVKDLDLGESHYAQVRILVDDSKYIKGMAVYSDNVPDGVDVVFNTNKKVGTPKLDVLKDIKSDPENPFGSLIKAKGQSYYEDENGKQQLSLINKTREEGDWSEWANTVPSQFLSKQSLSMAKKQLAIAKNDKLEEFNELCSLNNPTIKKHLLEKFADECDSDAVHLKAAALPGQRYHVIIPVNSLKDNEVYAPNYQDGTELALIRYPHGGTFEIPILKVNNKHEPARKLLGTDIGDAVGITMKVAERLSGADFDGDTVMCIPTNNGKVKITSTKPLKDLEGFDPKAEYPERPGMRYMKDPVTKKDNTQMQMGVISNLITDMTLAGAKEDELARAVRHSMVVIDAGKHKLDYKQSEIDHDIAGLKKKYQPKFDEDGNLVGYGGAATLISRAKGELSVDKRQGSPKVNMPGSKDYDPTKPEGAKIYKLADDLEYEVTKVNKRTGEVTTTVKTRKQQSTRMAETDDAYSLVSSARHPMELVYADYANSMKSLANQARKEMMTTGKIEYSASAKAAYQQEVDSLNAKLNTALLNTARERAAQRKANVEVEAKKLADPNMKKGDVRKASQQALTKYRNEVGSVARRDRSIKITDREWEAIQAGAISESKLKKILNNTDVDNLRSRATPRSTRSVSTAKANRIKSLRASGLTLSQIAEAVGVSTSTVSECLKT